MIIRTSSWARKQDFGAVKGKWLYKGSRQNRTGYMEDFMTLDTEFSSVAWEEFAGKGQPYRKRAYGLTYLWSACVFGEVYEGRTIEELLELLRVLQETLGLGKNRRLLCFVHNLGADFPYIYPWLRWNKIFAPQERRPLCCSCDEGFEFRCSWKLTNMSLEKFLQNEGAPHQKQSGAAYDYRALRTPDTKLSPFERYYAGCDVLGLYEAVHRKMDKDGDTTATVPMTSTGYVRRYCRNMCAADKGYRKMFKDQALEPEQYMLLWDARRGGNTHANRAWTGKVIEHVRSFDISSSYPATMLYDKYPMGPFHRVDADTAEDLDDIISRGKVFVARVRIQNLGTDDPVPYIPVSRIEQDPGLLRLGSKGYLHDNGRVLRQIGWTTMAITSVDWEIIRDHYVWSGLEIVEVHAARAAKLPKALRQAISDLFVEKTKLKGIEDKKYFYTKAKNRLNGIFGMTFTALVRDTVRLEEGTWSTESAEDLAGELERYYKSRNSFLHYQWGVFVAAFARKRLQEAIDICGDNLVYVDTDSVKYIETDEITAALEALNVKYAAMAESSDVTAKAFTEDGKIEILGLWDDEGSYEQFKTYGAKKYCYVKDGKFEFTVSGLGNAAYGEISCMDDFVLGKTVHNAGRTISIFDDDPNPHFVWLGGKEWELRTNMAIVDTTYTLGVTEEYRDLVDVLKEDYEFAKIDGKKILVRCSTGIDPD